MCTSYLRELADDTSYQGSMKNNFFIITNKGMNASIRPSKLHLRGSYFMVLGLWNVDDYNIATVL